MMPMATARAFKSAASGASFHPKPIEKSSVNVIHTLYRERNRIERFFNIIKQFQGIATRYEKTARNFLAGLHLVCAPVWVK